MLPRHWAVEPLKALKHNAAPRGDCVVEARRRLCPSDSPSLAPCPCFWCFYASSTMTSNPAEIRGVHSLPPSFGLPVCLLVTHRQISFMAAQCISGIFHPRKVLPSPKWREVLLDGGSSSHSSWGPAPLRSSGPADGRSVPGKPPFQSLCTDVRPPEMLLTIAKFQWKRISSQPHQFGFYSSVTSTLCRTAKPKNSRQMPFYFFTVPWYEYSSCNHKDLLTRSMILSSCY